MNKVLVTLLLFLSFASRAQVSVQTDSMLTDSLVADSVIVEEKPEPLMVDFPSYKMTFPDTWKVKNGCIETQCTINSPRDTLMNFDTYIESVNLTVNKLNNTSYTALKYADYSIGYLPKVVQQFQVLERKNLGRNSYRVTYRGVKNGLRQTWRQYYYVRSGKVYIVTFSAETRKYELYQPMIEPYLDSFTFK
ncbi:hypothetical protein [Jiulongibacter sediminis]|uniref:hypothetical protein n=1 Tax=Jiulongibacter sediminis TaxID=1605367 RepID=UPI0026EA83EC|nr:hypothetical protein [Jiulongibacter sediminis]